MNPISTSDSVADKRDRNPGDLGRDAATASAGQGGVQVLPEAVASEAMGRRRYSSRSALRFGLVGVFVLGLILILGFIPRLRDREAIAKAAKQQQSALPVVTVTPAVRAKGEGQLALPGTSAAVMEAPIYARASGYVSKRLVDIGDRVRAGQLLAVVDAPDLDQQVDQARASLQQSESVLRQTQAQAKLASLTWERYKVLVTRGVFSQQDGDTQEANYNVWVANVRAAEDTVNSNRANLERLLKLQSYERVEAPFAGVVIVRNIDVGSLISSYGGGLGGGVNTGGTGSVTIPVTGSATLGAEMFRVARIDHLRVYVGVPESHAPYVSVGQAVTVNFDSAPGKTFPGKVVRTANAIDPTTRTLLTQVEMENPGGQLMPGTYGMVSFKNVRAAPPVIIPGDTLITRAQGTMVALVRDGSVHLRPVVIGRDHGANLEVREGLAEGDLIVVNPGDSAKEGAKVTTRMLAAQAGEAGGAQDPAQ